MTPAPGVASPFDLAAALDAALDQVAHGEAHVGFERVDARRMQPIAQRPARRDGASTSIRATGSPANVRLSIELRRRHAQRSRALGIGRANVEVRTLAIVAHEERAAILQATVDVDDGNARAVRRGSRRDSSPAE